jgi:hypothetical protein
MSVLESIVTPANAAVGLLVALGAALAAAYAFGRWTKAPDRLSDSVSGLTSVVKNGFDRVEKVLDEHGHKLLEQEKAAAAGGEWRRSVDEDRASYDDRLHKHSTMLTGHDAQITNHDRRITRLEDAS